MPPRRSPHRIRAGRNHGEGRRLPRGRRRRAELRLQADDGRHDAAAFKPAFGNPAAIAQRAAERLAKQEECKKDLIPTPGRFLFAFGRPDVLAARQAERCAKWEWSSEFLAKARPDKAGVGNYGAGDVFDDGLTVLERNQIAAGKGSFLTGGAKAAFRRDGELPASTRAGARLSL